MKARCLNPTDDGYPDHGGKGIKVCERWMDFANFLADMGERPKKMQLGRNDRNGNYEPGNCRWMTRREISDNKRSVVLTYNGQSHNVCEWARILGLNHGTIFARIKYGWPVERILTERATKLKTNRPRFA